MDREKAALVKALNDLLNPSKLDDFLTCAVGHDDPMQGAGPRTALLSVKFQEDAPNIDGFAEFLWGQCMYYALPRKRRLRLQKDLKDDLSLVARIHTAVRDVFIKFRKDYPSRASEVGEVLAYVVTQQYLVAPQIAAKVALKTSGNMPVHGLDGIHAKFDNDALTIFFLESKLSKSANDGVKEYASSASSFLAKRSQYLREYEIVGDFGHLDSLSGAARKAALDYFDIMGKPTLPRRERFVGVICYSERKHFSNTIPADNGPVDQHEKHFLSSYREEFSHHQAAAKAHIEQQGGDTAKNLIYFIAVPDVDVLREKFYDAISGPIEDTASSSARGDQ